MVCAAVAAAAVAAVVTLSVFTVFTGVTIVVNRWCFPRCLYPHLPVPAYLVDIFSMFFSSVAFHSLTHFVFLPLLFSAAEEVLTVVVLWWYSLLSYLLIY